MNATPEAQAAIQPGAIHPGMRIIPMIGHPVAQVKSLAPMNAWFGRHGVDCRLIAVDIAPEHAPGFLAAVRGWANCPGVSITLPHKQAAFAACDRLTERARIARAVNIIRRESDGSLSGDMTDGAAFVGEIARRGVRIQGCAFLLIGAGGAGGAVAHAMAEGGASAITVIEIDGARREALLAALRAGHPALRLAASLEPGEPVDVAFNATPLGMNEGDPPPFPLDALPQTALIADAVTKPVVTAWLEQARARGHRIQTGEEMAVAQLPIQLPIWGFDEPQ